MSDGSGRRLSITILVLFLVILVYFFAVAEPLYPELSVAPRWTIDIGASSANTADSVSGSELFSFSSGNHNGYFSLDGKGFTIPVATERVIVSDASYVLLKDDSSGSELKSPQGSLIADIASSSVFFSGGRLFSSEDEGTGLNAYDVGGQKLWSYTFPCQLSAFASGDNLVVGGTVDGWLEGIRPDGVKAFSFSPGGSRLSVILGLGVSQSGQWLAAISGIDRQRLVVLGRGGTDFKVSSHRYLDTDYREPLRVIVMDDDRHVLYRRPDGIGVWSVDGSVNEVLPVKADDFDISLDRTKNIAYLVARRGHKSEIVAFRLPATLLGRIALPDTSEYVRFVGSSAFVGGGSWLLRFDFVEE
ncbi:MAG: hypothetical protein RBT62_09395 [Spirochaetia bacterium]|jgi:hypothetical protein|nr:hypothetical protein [Spirochaetia bacterium]